MTFSPPKDGEYSDWNIALASRYPLALSEMRRPSEALGTFEARALARWGIECGPGWRPVIERLLDRLESAIIAEPVDRRDGLRVVDIKEKFGRLTVYLASEGTPAMDAAIREGAETSVVTCDVCSAPGSLAERNAGWAVRCATHESWSRGDRPQ